MSKYLSMMIGLFGSLVLSTALFAGEQSKVDFSSLDQDGDGTLSAVEASTDPELSSKWSEIDKDENGVIDEAEFSAFESTYEYGSEGSSEETPAAGSSEGQPMESQ